MLIAGRGEFVLTNTTFAADTMGVSHGEERAKQNRNFGKWALIGIRSWNPSLYKRLAIHRSGRIRVLLVACVGHSERHDEGAPTPS